MFSIIFLSFKYVVIIYSLFYFHFLMYFLFKLEIPFTYFFQIIKDNSWIISYFPRIPINLYKYQLICLCIYFVLFLLLLFVLFLPNRASCRAANQYDFIIFRTIFRSKYDSTIFPQKIWKKREKKKKSEKVLFLVCVFVCPFSPDELCIFNHWSDLVHYKISSCMYELSINVLKMLRYC